VAGKGGRALAAALLLALLSVLAGCASLVSFEEAVPNPAVAPGDGLVVLFNGFTFFSEGNRGTGTYALAESIRRAGVRAEIDRPGGWEALAEAVIREPGLRGAPVAVYGYSAGVPAAARFAERLGAAGVPVQTLAALESWGEVSVPCSVRAAVQLRLDGGGDRLVAARPGCVAVVNRVFVPTGGGSLNHYSAASDWEVLEAMRRELLDGGRVRLRE
jgi:hypothetical protein